MFVEWNQEQICFSCAELQKLHLHLFQLNVTKLYNLLKRARPQEVNSSTKKVLEEIAEACQNCRRHRSRPYRFRVSLPADDIKLNHEIAADLM